MTIRVKLFAVVRERAGFDELSLDLPDTCSVGDAIALLGEKLPAIREMLARAAFAVNREYAPRDATLSDGDELAVIPAVSGG